MSGGSLDAQARQSQNKPKEYLMMSAIEPFLTAELDYRREKLMAEFARSKAARATSYQPIVHARTRLVPGLVRRAFAGH
jgi:hypothetical protein